MEIQAVYEDITKWRNSILSTNTIFKEESIQKDKETRQNTLGKAPTRPCKILWAPSVQNNAEKHQHCFCTDAWVTCIPRTAHVYEKTTFYWFMVAGLGKKSSFPAQTHRKISL